MKLTRVCVGCGKKFGNTTLFCNNCGNVTDWLHEDEWDFKSR